MNSPVGFITAFFASVTGFAMIWQIWWLAGLGLVAAYAGFVVFAWSDVHEHEVPAAEVARIDRARRASREAALKSLAPTEAAS
jgi:cytochrome o ubiquinol oxidase subunit 1